MKNGKEFSKSVFERAADSGEKLKVKTYSSEKLKLKHSFASFFSLCSSLSCLFTRNMFYKNRLYTKQLFF